MNRDDIYKGAALVEQVTFTDDELRSAIQSTAYALSYCEGRGNSYLLASRMLRQELNALESLAWNRQWTPQHINALKD